MDESLFLLTAAAATTIALAIVATALLRGWQRWIELRRVQVSEGHEVRAPVELSRLRARVRRLEAIASGGTGREFSSPR